LITKLENIIEKLMLSGKMCIPILENNGVELRVHIFYLFCLYKKEVNEKSWRARKD